ncbi:phage tail fiber protein [Enterobacter kobei]|uniref:phage tail fiber domain-containing protein n=1 Tax=Enterobacter kobei TaxID=208224 RepID=UPI002FD0280A
MSVPNQTPYIIYNANGLTTVFPFEFYIINAGDIQVSINGTVVTSGYSVSGVGNVGGGDVVFVTPPASGAVVMLERVVPTYRLTDYQDNGDLLADTVNKDFDRLWMAIQRAFIYLGLALRRPLFGGPFNAEGYRIANLGDPINAQDAATKNYVDNVSLVRTLRVPETTVSILPPVDQRANKLLAFNAAGQPIVVLPASGSASDVMIEFAKPTGAGLSGYDSSLDYAEGTVGRFLNDAVNYLTPQMFGVEPSDTSIIGSALDDMFSQGGDIRFEKRGTYITDRTWVLRSGTRLWIGPGVTIKLANGSNVPIFKNYSYANSAAVDAYIEIWGPGTIDYNGSNQTVVGLGSMASILKGITSLKIGGGIKVIGANKYAWLVCNVTYFTADGLNFDTNSDGLHCQPPIRHSYIRNLKGKTGDDMLAFTIGDYANYNISEPGDFSNVDAAGLFCENALCAVKITGDGTGNFVRMKFSGIYGDTLHSVFRVWGDTNLTKTTIKNLTIEDVHAVPGAAYDTIEFNDRGFGTSGFSIEIDEVHIKNVYSTNTTKQTVSCSGTFGSTIHHLVMENLPRTALTLLGVNNLGTINIDVATIKNANVVFPDNPNAAVVINRGTIGTLNIEDVVAIFINTTNGQIARLLPGCTVNQANWVNVYQARGQRGWNHITSAMSGGTELNLTNYTCAGDGRIAQTTGSTLTIRMSNCRRINDSGTQTAFFASGGTIILSGSIETGFNTIGTNSGGVIKTTPGLHNIPCNVDLLTPVDGASVHNLNAGLACGTGRVLAQTLVWKNLFSGATYTSTL